MKKGIVLLLLVAGLLVTSCKVRVSDNINTNKFSDKVSYFQDENTGEVYALVIVAKQVSMVQEGVGLAHIPRSELTPAITSQIKNYNPKLGLPKKK